jgi:branched-chain amino acid transport system substrate-binding protein
MLRLLLLVGRRVFRLDAMSRQAAARAVRFGCTVFLFLAGGTSTAFAGAPLASSVSDPGVSADEIAFGEPAPFTGPAAVLGLQMRLGLLAAFAEANRQGGVHGRQLKLVSYDDGYEPERSVAATRRLIDEDKVFALIGAVGTTTTAAIQPMAAKSGVPLIGALTGAEFLRDPANANVVNVRASYFQETEALVDRLTTDRGYSRFAVLYQDDSFGRAGLTGIVDALARRGLILVGQASFERNTVAVKLATLAIRRADPQVVIMIGPYRPCAEFVRLSRRVGFQAQLASISSLGSYPFAHELGTSAVGTVVSQVTPSPFDASLPLVARFQEAVKQYDSSARPDYLSLEGYATGRLAIAALERISGPPTRAALLAAIRGSTFDLGGMMLSYGTNDNRGSNRVFMTIIGADGVAHPVANLIESHG